MANRISYPFEPKSTAYLQPGQFWGFQRSDQAWACGRVIALQFDASGKRDSRCFLFALLDWLGDQPPTEASIAGATSVCQRDAHIKTIRENGRLILGCRDLSLDNIEPQLCLSQSGGRGCMLMRGYDVVRSATAKEIESLSVLPTAGYNAIRLLADKLTSPVA